MPKNKDIEYEELLRDITEIAAKLLGVITPGNEIEQVAKTLFDMKVAFISAGFTGQETMQLLIGFISGGKQ